MKTILACVIVACLLMAVNAEACTDTTMKFYAYNSWPFKIRYRHILCRAATWSVYCWI